MGDLKWIPIANFATKIFRLVLDFIAGLNGDNASAIRRAAADVVSPDTDTEEIGESPSTAFVQPTAPKPGDPPPDPADPSSHGFPPRE